MKVVNSSAGKYRTSEDQTGPKRLNENQSPQVMLNNEDQVPSFRLSAASLGPIRDQINESIQTTALRTRYLLNPTLEEPHLKLLTIDLINYLLGLLTNEDRKTLIAELYEQQLVLDDEDPDDNRLKSYMSKQEDLEFKTL